MCVVFILIDGHFLLTLELEIIDGHHRLCHPKGWAQHFVGKIFVFIDALKYSAIPFCILLLLSILIIQRVFHAEDISAQLQNLRSIRHYRQYSTSSNSASRRPSTTLPVPTTTSNLMTNSNTRVGRRVTLMLLSVSIAFCVFSAPMSLMQIVQSIIQPDYYELPLAIGKAIAELCQYVNHSCNFFLYALTGRIFRREFVRLFFPTRFGSGPGTNGGMPMNGLGLNGRATVFIPPISALSARHLSVYTMDIHRSKTYQTDDNHHHVPHHTSTHLKSVSCPKKYNQQMERSSTMQSALLPTCRPSALLIEDRLYSSGSAMQNPITTLWNLFTRTK
jgi:hypothetical protein